MSRLRRIASPSPMYRHAEFVVLCSRLMFRLELRKKPQQVHASTHVAHWRANSELVTFDQLLAHPETFLRGAMSWWL